MSNVFQLQGVVGGADAVTAVGTALSGGAALTGAVNNVTTAGGQTAVVLPARTDFPSSPVIVHVNSATTGLVFPPSSTVAINEGSAGASFSVAQGKTAIFIQTSATQYIALLGA